jgi:ABC-type Na+ transport system ATPase subunit NatA
VIVIAGGTVVAQGSIDDVMAQAGCKTLEDAFVTLSLPVQQAG